MKFTLLKYLTLAAVAGMVTERASAATTVGLELALLVDVSGSVSTAEWELQRDGHVAAFQSPTIQNAITTLALKMAAMAWRFPISSGQRASN